VRAEIFFPISVDTAGTVSTYLSISEELILLAFLRSDEKLEREKRRGGRTFSMTTSPSSKWTFDFLFFFSWRDVNSSRG
jgi:hypothetical protein